MSWGRPVLTSLEFRLPVLLKRHNHLLRNFELHVLPSESSECNAWLFRVVKLYKNGCQDNRRNTGAKTLQNTLGVHVRSITVHCETMLNFFAFWGNGKKSAVCGTAPLHSFAWRRAPVSDSFVWFCDRLHAPLSLRLHVPILSADSSTTTDAEKQLADNSSWPITEMTTKGLESSFMFFSDVNRGPNLSETKVHIKKSIWSWNKVEVLLCNLSN